ncbi:hypothetical protein [Polymorphum gilvum]|uniref:NADH dehydrogenase subunit H n=1 Tax=Polymorphum gilvum (strain LMG 25793 / CGMCC 1.9160 / SL003B-26A1) TaxID=991905 RepID=F2IXZ8_POLGS|nr:hypothetical protein [Polymorphum gilvum]ADZ70501.1 NADH dehydrogenase subunit H [Polymorphum gilvum SL003B-26A1]
MDVSVAGLIGAAIGLYIGWLDYGILNGLLSAAVEKNKRKGGGFAVRHEPVLRKLVFILPIAGFPVIGYLAAKQLVG